jgi:trans-2,3-dihydro-3-hydroxyanthranilate isomerase
MKRLAYHRLDVFTRRALAGNPLAVVLEADELDAAQMQAIAREFNLSETVFVLAPRDSVNTARLRIFTPTLELPFAGHPTVGAACLIAQLRAPDMIGRPLRLVLEEEAGPVACEVVRHQGALRANFVAPKPPQFIQPLSDRAAIAAALALDESDIGFDSHEPATATAGVPFAFVPLKSLSALNAVAPDFARFGAAFPLQRPAVFLYTRETNDPAHHVQARVFVPGLGVHEDPATGSAACAFAAIALRFEQPEDGEHAIVIEQGYAMGRPSQIALTMQVEAGALVQTEIGGASVMIAEGVLTL